MRGFRVGQELIYLGKVVRRIILICYFCDKGHNVKGFLCVSSYINGPLISIYTSGWRETRWSQFSFLRKPLRMLSILRLSLHSLVFCTYHSLNYLPCKTKDIFSNNSNVVILITRLFVLRLDGDRDFRSFLVGWNHCLFQSVCCLFAKLWWSMNFSVLFSEHDQIGSEEHPRAT